MLHNQNKGFTQIVGQVANSRFQFDAEFIFHAMLHGVRTLCLFKLQVFIRSEMKFVLWRASGGVANDVQRNAEQPGGSFRIAPKAVPAAVGFDQGLLKNIFYRIFVPKVLDDEIAQTFFLLSAPKLAETISVSVMLIPMFTREISTSGMARRSSAIGSATKEPAVRA